VCELLTAAEAMRDYPAVTVSAEVAALVANGRVLDRFEGAGPWAVLGPDGSLLAVYESFGEAAAKPAVVLG
jgi:hypothetical protein